MKKLLLVLFASVVFPAVASASISFAGNPTITGSSGSYAWSYTPTLNTGESLTGTVPGGSCDTASSPIEGSIGACGSFFTIYDVVDYIPGSAFAPGLGTNWAISVQMTGLTPNTVAPTDGGAVNITFYFIGGGTVTGTGQTLGLAPGSFGFESTSDIVNTNGWYTYQANSDNPPDQGDGHIWVPGSLPAPTPEPASMLLLGTGLLGLASVRRRLLQR